MVFHFLNGLKEPNCTEERREEEEERKKEERYLEMWSCLLQRYVEEKTTVFTLTAPITITKTKPKQTPEA